MGEAQASVRDGFRSRSPVLLTVATGGAAILAFGDRVGPTDASGSNEMMLALTFWLGVFGFIATAIGVLFLQLPMRWRQNPGGAPRYQSEAQRTRIDALRGSFPAYDKEEIRTRSIVNAGFLSDDRSYAEMLTTWSEIHRFNYRVNEMKLAWMGRVTSLAVCGVAVLVVAWTVNGYAITTDSEQAPTRTDVRLVDDYD